MSTTTNNYHLIKYESTDNVSPVGYNSNFDTIDTQLYTLDNKITGISSDYIIEQGTSGIWTYRKWNSGIAELWGRATLTYVNPNVYHTTFGYPFTFIETPVAIATPDSGGNSWSELDINAKVVPQTTSVTVFFHSSSGSMTTTTANIHVMGRWQ